jgi:hypothetical protein
MKIEIKELNDDLESTENTHIVYVKSETNQSIEAELCNEIELDIYITKYKNKYDITEVIRYEL